MDGFHKATRTSYTLAEAEYLLRLADQRMRIERNPENAVVLMRTAQALLGQLEDGRLLPIREQLAGDIQTLASIERIDVLGIQAEILALDAVLDRLQLPVRRLQPPPSESQEADAQSNWLTVLSEYVRIRQVDAPITPLVTAADAGRAREVLRLNLEQIKVALIREDQAIFDASVAQAVRMTTHYFSTTEGAGLRVLQTLEQLQGQSIARDIPDASTGLRALQAFRASEVSRRAIADEVRRSPDHHERQSCGRIRRHCPDLIAAASRKPNHHGFTASPPCPDCHRRIEPRTYGRAHARFAQSPRHGPVAQRGNPV